jgi:hypothetical protein
LFSSPFCWWYVCPAWRPASPSLPIACLTARSKPLFCGYQCPAWLHSLQVDNRIRSAASWSHCKSVEYHDIAEPCGNADRGSHLQFAVKVTGCGWGTSQVSYKVVIQAAASAVGITTSSMPNGMVKTAYSAVIKAAVAALPTSGPSYPERYQLESLQKRRVPRHR